MPPLETSALHQRAVLWSKVRDDAYGEVVVSADPDEITVRWENRRFEMTEPDGAKVAIEAVVTVAQAVVIGSLLWKGELEDLVGTGGPDYTTQGYLMQVHSFEEIPDIKGRAVYRELFLRRYRNTMPTQV